MGIDSNGVEAVDVLQQSSAVATPSAMALNAGQETRSMSKSFTFRQSMACDVGALLNRAPEKRV
jgi:hypothetical protein